MRQLKISKNITQRNEASINRYFQEINRYPLITPEEEVELTVRIRSGDEQALEKLVSANLRFVISVAKQYQNKGLSFSDLINEGNLGLVKAAQRFDETRGFKFISYAVWWIRQSIMQAISEQTRIVRLPINRLSSINKISKAIPYLEQTYNRQPTDDEIADYLTVSDEEVKTANFIKKKQVSFDKPISSNGEQDFSLYDLIQNGDIPAPDNQLMEESLKTNIRRALAKLTVREASIITLYFGLSGKSPLSLHEIGAKLELSSERVRQLKTNALIKLKTIVKNKFIFHDID